MDKAMNWSSPRFYVPAIVLLGLALLPVYSMVAGQPFYVTLFSRIMIFALAALGLNLILGYGGLVSFGHALYLGVGAYAVGILSFHGITNGWVHLAAALGIGIVTASLIGTIVLRTSGMTFIMITLAFAQMGYFFVVSLKAYGGDDGLTIDNRSSMVLFDLSNHTVLYYAILVCLAGVFLVFTRLIGSRFGMVLRGVKSNERRMLALGFPTFRYKLVGYVISAQVCVLAGFFLANLTKFASPSYMVWQVSGDLIVMAVLGGMGTLFGPVIGAILYLVVEEFLSSLNPGWFPKVEDVLNKHWLALMGLFVILMVLGFRKGLYGYLVEREQKKLEKRAQS
jgi:branched-chain amino acid transport system permease protein